MQGLGRRAVPLTVTSPVAPPRAYNGSSLASSEGARPRNLLLRSLRDEDRALVEPHLRRARFDRDQHLAEAGAPIAEAFFLEGGIASVLAHGRDGAHIEVGVVGHEGMAPVGAILGADTSPHEVLVQIAGPDALAIATPVLRDLMRANEGLREGLQRYAMAFLSQMAGTVMSNGKQPV